MAIPSPTPYVDCLTTVPPTCHKITSDDLVPFDMAVVSVAIACIVLAVYIIVIKPFLRH